MVYQTGSSIFPKRTLLMSTRWRFSCRASWKQDVSWLIDHRNYCGCLRNPASTSRTSHLESNDLECFIRIPKKIATAVGFCPQKSTGSTIHPSPTLAQPTNHWAPHQSHGTLRKSTFARPRAQPLDRVLVSHPVSQHDQHMPLYLFKIIYIYTYLNIYMYIYLKNIWYNII